MSTLKFKSKISVPGVDCTSSDGGKFTLITPGQAIVNNGDENLNTTITPGKIELSYNEDDEIKATLSYSGIDIKQIKTNQITQKDTAQSITIGSSSSAPAQIDYIKTSDIQIGNKGLTLTQEDIQDKNIICTDGGSTLTDGAQ